MAKMVTVDMEVRMLTRVAVEKKASLRIAVKMMTARTSTMTAAQFSMMWPALFRLVEL